MKWDQSFTKRFTIMNYGKLLKNLKRELIKYPIPRDKIKKNPSQLYNPKLNFLELLSK